MDKAKIRFLRMQRQFFTIKANEQDYLELYRDMRPAKMFTGMVSDSRRPLPRGLISTIWNSTADSSLTGS